MEILAFDTETALIRPGLLAPPLVCVTWQSRGGLAGIIHHRDGLSVLKVWLESRQTIFVGHNVSYDFAVVGERYPELLPLIFDAYAEDRVTDTGIRQKLLDIAGGVYRGRVGEKGRWITHEYSLEALAKRVAGMQLVKDAWRLSYGEFIDAPLVEWPNLARSLQARAAQRISQLEALPHAGKEDKAIKKEIDGLREMVNGDPNRCTEYPLDDARATLAIWEGQEKHAAYLDDQYRQARAAWALHLSSAWGLRTDATGVEVLRRETQASYDALLDELVAAGLVRPDGTRDTKAASARMVQVCKEENLPLRRTATHGTKPECDTGEDCHVCLDADACNASGDPLLENYAELSTLKKVLTNDVEALSKGIEYPVHTRYGMAETARTTSSGPNIQNLRRKAGIREAFVPRAGKVFAACDYPSLELYTLAQCCVSWIGKSALADALNGGQDPHTAMAANIVGVPYDVAVARLEAGHEVIDNARQTAKVANFGFPGGLGIEKLRLFAKKTYGVELSFERAKQLKEQWYATWPEMPHYFARVNALCDTPSGKASVETLFTRRFRGGASYCAACNNGFQALGADCAKNAGWNISRCLYTSHASPLFNARMVAFVHDEFILETSEGPTAHDAALELAKLMREGANVYLPDVQLVAAKMKPLLMKRWSKKAKPLFDQEGRLVPWQ